MSPVDVRLQGDERTEAEPLLEGIRVLLGRARDAAYRDNPIPSKWASWWRGTLIEAAYQNLHAAEALIVRLYSDDEVAAEVPEVIARVESGLNRDDPRRVSAWRVVALPPGPSKRAEVSELVEIGYAAGDMQHSRLRSFRKTTLVSTGILALFLFAFVVAVSRFPTAVPFCFQPTRDGPLYCPTGSSVPSSGDVWVISLLGLLGGALAAAVSIRNIRGTSTPYDLPIAVSVLKVPFGVLTAIAAIIAIRGEFVPGLASLDSQAQILAYAFVFGYSQQLLTGMIDKQAQTLLEEIPSKDASHNRPEQSSQPSS